MARSSEAVVSRVSTEGIEATGDNDDKERRPGAPDEPPDSDGATSTSGGCAYATTELGNGEKSC